MAPLRIVQWATGNIGTRALQGVIDHPAMELVGLWVHSPDKVGRDAGELCDRPTTGVVATGDLEAVVSLGADCVLYMPRSLDVDEVCRLLRSGSNVVTTRGELHHPPSLDPSIRERLDAACAEGGSSVHSTGSSPGFITEALPLVLTSVQRRLDGVLVEEFADLSRRPSPDLLFQVMGFGRPPGEIGQHRIDHGRDSFGPSLRTTADALGLPLDDVQATGEVAVARDAIEIAAGTIEAGTVAGQRTTVTGHHDGRPILRFRASWYCSHDLDPAWDLLPTGWRVTVDGDAPLKVDLPFPFGIEEMAERAPGYTANRAVNAVEAVCAAAPGIRTIADLPPVVARLG